MSSHVDTPDSTPEEEPLSSIVLTDGQETTLVTAPGAGEESDPSIEHDAEAEAAEIDEAIESVVEAAADDAAVTDAGRRGRRRRGDTSWTVLS